MRNTALGRRGTVALALMVGLSANGRLAMGQSLSHAPELNVVHDRALSHGDLLTPNTTSDGKDLPTDATARVQAGTSPLFRFDESQIKFKLKDLMNILRDHEHEGWVLAAYPDPKTRRPLIGAGFSLDVPETVHLQHDPLNANAFVEPSSEQLWRAANLDPDRLRAILQRFDRDVKAWSNKKYRRKVAKQSLPPELTEEQALALLRVSTIQAVENARAYCRDFDEMTGAQQMALSQLVFQIGVNLEQFVQFLSALNGDNSYSDLTEAGGGVESEGEHWNTVQRRLIDSQWATRYTTRATTVIAMFDPVYAADPASAKLRVEAVLQPRVKPVSRKRQAKVLRVKYDRKHRAASKTGSHHKTKLT